MLKKKLTLRLLPLILLLLTGCSTHSGIRLFNYDLGSFFGGTPDYVTVQKGDTLYSIARRYNVPIRDMIEANGLRPPYTLNIGRVLKMPNARFHIVEKGDTVYNISKRYDVDMRSISKLNNIAAPYALRIGQRLVIPGSVVSSSTTPTTARKAATVSKTSSWKASSTKKKTTSAAKKKTTRTTTTTVKKRTSKFAWPVQGKVVSNFGPIAKGRNNDGINIKAPLGTPVKAADAGTVAYAGNELRGFGNLILIKHSGGWMTAYAHNDRILVRKGQKVKKGEKISTVGSTGGVSTPQLHFEIRAGKKAVNPKAYLP